MNLIRERIDAATTAENLWNAFPDQLDVISFKSVDLTDPNEAYEYGWLIGQEHAYRQIRFHNFPRETWPDLKKAGWKANDMSLVYTHFLLAAPRGQEDDPTKRNIRVVTAPQRDYSSYKAGVRPSYLPGLIIEIGCKHDYDDAGSRHQRGYHLGKCKRCGHKWMCDSGD